MKPEINLSAFAITNTKPYVQMPKPKGVEYDKILDAAYQASPDNGIGRILFYHGARFILRELKLTEL